MFGSELPVGSGDNGWWLWGPPRPAPSVVVWIAGRREDMDALFADVREVAEFDHPLMRAEGWPRLKHYR